MSAVTDIPELKRIRFFTGQRLTAEDMTELQRANRELRWLHNRSLHSWGIGIGYGVTGERGDTSVTVAPGYAIDCMGRELILIDPVTLTVPAVAAASDGKSAAVYYLTASYIEDADQNPAEARPGVCLPSGTVRLTEGPLIQWQQLKDVRNGLDVVLAQGFILNCELSAPLGLAVRRSARPQQQPYIAAGQTVAANTIWSMKFESGQAVGVTTRVDTSSARFSVAPVYFAHVMGPREFSTPAGPQTAFTLVAVSSPAPDGFTCDVYLPPGDSGSQLLSPAEISGLLNTLNWSVAWMGVEG